MTFGVSSMVFYGSYHYLNKGMGNSIWTWMISGATTGIVGGIFSNPRYIPITTLCFTCLGAVGYAGSKVFDRYYRMKHLKIKILSTNVVYVPKKVYLCKVIQKHRKKRFITIKERYER